jgi:hypothetical protein
MSRPIEIENVLSGRDQLLKTVEIIHHVKIDFYFISVKIFKIEIFQSRIIFVEIFIEIVETNRDRRDKSRIFEISRHNQDFFKTFLRLQAQKSRQIEKSRSRTVITLTNSRSRSRKTVEICQKCHVSTDFSVSIETFRTFRTCRDKIEISRS